MTNEFLKLLSSPAFWTDLTIISTTLATFLKVFWGKLGNTHNVLMELKSSNDIAVFERKFIRKFKKDTKSHINNMTTDDDLELFLKSGINQLSEIFKIILDARFDISESELKDEFSDAKLNLISKFKSKNPEYKAYTKIISTQVFEFLTYFSDIKKLSNGERMKEFEKLAKKTSISIIAGIVKL